MKRRVLAGLFLLMILQIEARSQKLLSLREAVDIAIKNNLDVKQAGLDVQAADANLRQARANRYPSLEGFAFHGTNQGRSIDPFTNQFINQQISYANYGVNTSVPVFAGFSIHNTVRANALARDASQMELQQNRDNVTLNVILAYLQLLTASDQLQQSKNQLQLSMRQVERLEILHTQGAIAPALYFDLKGELAGNQLALVNNQNSVDAARLTLSQLMNIAYDSALYVERLPLDNFETTYEATPDEIYQTALEQLAIVKAAELRHQSAERNVRAIKGLLYPSLSLNGNLTTNYSSAAFRDIFISDAEVQTNNYVNVNGTKVPVISPTRNYRSERIMYRDQLDNNLFTSVNLGLRIPVFNSLQTRTRVRLAQINEKSTDYIAETAKIQLKQNIEQAYFNMTAARNRYKTILDQVAAFSESFRTAEVRFEAGAINSVDYLVAKNNLDRANINLINARYDFVLRTKVLDYFRARPLW